MKEVKKESTDAIESARDAMTCAICMEAPRDCLYMPCAHLATCSACDTALQVEGKEGTCAICQGTITSRIHGVRLP